MFRCELQVPARLLPDAQAVARTVAEPCAGEIMPRQTLVPRTTLPFWRLLTRVGTPDHRLGGRLATNQQRVRPSLAASSSRRMWPLWSSSVMSTILAKCFSPAPRRPPSET